MQIAKIYQDGKYIESIACGSFNIQPTATILYQDLEYRTERAVIPNTMMIIFDCTGNPDYDKMGKDLKERKL